MRSPVSVAAALLLLTFAVPSSAWQPVPVLDGDTTIRPGSIEWAFDADGNCAECNPENTDYIYLVVVPPPVGMSRLRASIELADGWFVVELNPRFVDADPDPDRLDLRPADGNCLFGEEPIWILRARWLWNPPGDGDLLARVLPEQDRLGRRELSVEGCGGLVRQPLIRLGRMASCFEPGALYQPVTGCVIPGYWYIAGLRTRRPEPGPEGALRVPVDLVRQAVASKAKTPIELQTFVGAEFEIFYDATLVAAPTFTPGSAVQRWSLEWDDSRAEAGSLRVRLWTDDSDEGVAVSTRLGAIDLRPEGQGVTPVRIRVLNLQSLEQTWSFEEHWYLTSEQRLWVGADPGLRIWQGRAWTLQDVRAVAQAHFGPPLMELQSVADFDVDNSLGIDVVDVALALGATMGLESLRPGRTPEPGSLVDDQSVSLDVGSCTAGHARLKTPSGDLRPVHAWTDGGIVQAHRSYDGRMQIAFVDSVERSRTIRIWFDDVPDPSAWTLTGWLAQNLDGTRSDATFDTQIATATAPTVAALPEIVEIAPNPFNPRTTIRFRAVVGERTTVTVYDSRGRRVQRLFDALTDAEEQSLVWSPKGLASGAYLVQVSSGGGSAVAKISLIE